MVRRLRRCASAPGAESNLALARQVVEEMYIRVAGQLEDVPRMDDYQRTIMVKAREFYVHEALLQSPDSATRLGAAWTQLRLAYIDRKLGELDEARAMAERAQALFESLNSDDPSRIEPVVGAAEARASLGRIEAQARNFPVAWDQYRHAIELREKLTTKFPGEARYRFELGFTWRDLGQASSVPSPRRGRFGLLQRPGADRDTRH